MLMQIPEYYTSDLLRVMLEMGHGDELLICDGNYPYKRYHKDTVMLLGYDIATILKDMLDYFPLDQSVEEAVMIMDNPDDETIVKTYEKIISEAKYPTKIKSLERFSFYDYANCVVGVIVTSDTKKRANVILKKGVVTDEDKR